jgi:hypothetical protein
VIEGIVGLPGQGKTYEGVRRLLVHADAGKQCFSTTPINHPNVEHIQREDVTDPELPPGLLFLDEIHLWLGSNDFRALDPEWYEKLSQTRKDGHNVIWTSQSPARVLKQLRDNTNYIWKTRAYFPLLGKPRMFSAACWEAETYLRGKPIARYMHPFENYVARAYDTRYAIKAHAAVIETPGRARRESEE